MVSLPTKRIRDNRWIFIVEYHYGFIERFKARLVAWEFIQTYRIDYEETFVHVLNTIWVLLSLAANLDWKLYQLYVKNVFFSGELI